MYTVMMGGGGEEESQGKHVERALNEDYFEAPSRRPTYIIDISAT